MRSIPIPGANSVSLSLRAALVATLFLAPSASRAGDDNLNKGPSRFSKTEISRSTAQSFHTVAAEYLDAYWAFHPIRAAAAGLHHFDGRLPDRSRPKVKAWVLYNEDIRRRLDGVDPFHLTVDQRVDFRILQFQTGEELFDWQALAVHRSNPMTYDVGWALLNVIRRDYAPAKTRARVAVTLFRGVPDYYSTAWRTLDDTLPEALCRAAIQMLEGASTFFQNDVPNAFADLSDEELKSELKQSADRAALAVNAFVVKLRTEKLPKATPTFAIGKSLFERMLRDTEGLTIAVPSLLELGQRDLIRNLDRAKAIADEHFGGESLESAFARLRSAAYANDRLIPEIAAELEAIRQFCVDRDIVTIPSDVRARVTETPSFARWASAMMDTPGPFETVATEAYYDVTPADPAWPADEQRDWLADFNKYVARNVSVHEAYPGHYVQFLHSNLAPTPIQKAFVSYAGSEGWAHYTEEMMIEVGIHDGDPLYELAQLQDALLRNCRFVCAIQMHTSNMTVEDATRFFMDNAFLGEITSRREAERGTFDPGYFKYTLGKMQILKLRDDYRRKLGGAFTLKAFHDAFLAKGMPPVIVTRERMLPGSKEPSL